MNTLKYLTISLITILLAVTACTSDVESKEKPITVEQLVGDWVLKAAARDGQKTGSLEGTYMRFSGKDQLSCNFTGEEVKGNFSFKDKEITHGEQTYKIESLSESELVVSTNLMDFDFKLTFRKSEK